MDLPLQHMHYAPLPACPTFHSPLCRERKFSVCEVKAMTTPSTLTTPEETGGMGDTTFSLGTHRGQRKLLLVIAQTWKEHFFPRSLLRILYNHMFSSLLHIDIHSQREKLISEYWVINYMRYISL